MKNFSYPKHIFQAYFTFLFLQYLSVVRYLNFSSYCNFCGIVFTYAKVKRCNQSAFDLKGKFVLVSSPDFLAERLTAIIDTDIQFKCIFSTILKEMLNISLKIYFSVYLPSLHLKFSGKNISRRLAGI